MSSKKKEKEAWIVCDACSSTYPRQHILKHRESCTPTAKLKTESDKLSTCSEENDHHVSESSTDIDLLQTVHECGFIRCCVLFAIVGRYDIEADGPKAKASKGNALYAMKLSLAL